MGKKKRRQQEDLWVATSELPRTAGHPFYERLNGLFNEHGFDDFVEGLCAKFYADKMGRPSLAPGVYFRLLLVGYFEGIGSERGLMSHLTQRSVECHDLWLWFRRNTSVSSWWRQGT